MILGENASGEAAESASGKLPEDQKRSSHATQRIQTTQISQPSPKLTQNSQERYRNPLEGRQNTIRSSSGTRNTHARNQDVSISAQAENIIPSSAHQTHNDYDHFEPRDLRRTLSTPANESEYTSASDLEQFQLLKQQYTNLKQQHRHLQSQYEQALCHIQNEKQTTDSLKASLEESEAQRANFQQRLEEASNTIFRLRPQRQEYTESEIEEDYEKLVKVIKNWVNINCESFVDDDVHGFDTLGRYGPLPGGHDEAFEEIIVRFQSQPMRWINAKEHVLVAAIMRYIYERILNQRFSVLLYPKEQTLLTDIQVGVEDKSLPKDLLAVRTWRSCTVAAIDSHEYFVNRRPVIEEKFALELRNFLGGALSDKDSGAVSSLQKEIIAPTITLAHKTQSSISIWKFRYSGFLAHKPGEFGLKIPKFLSNIQDFRCINLSNRDKILKPANDLSTKEEKESLLYVLDIFPGLFCQRVTAGDFLPLSTISQPILLVTFASKENHAQKE